jgi:DNA-directed RNA polymerase
MDYGVRLQLKEKLFWFPNFIDFRGRVYPTSIYLSQISNDVGRSLLLFGKGKKLGPNGLDWLKIHLINLTGTKKSSTNQERLEYANEIMPDIVDSAENPLDGKGWWKKSDDPWQTLACCIEINKVQKSENPAEYISYFPVHQDGSCNGLQHYAALGRDLDGARSVNLIPQNRPADVYSEVASIVEKKRFIDANNGDVSAIALDGHINRKLVKATVMTNVYGVTSYGAKLQFKKVLEEIDSFPKDKLNICSVYLAKTVFSTIEDLFTCSKEIQDWLIAISIAISKRLNQPIEWVTPLGFPVVQYYFKENSKTIKVDSNKQKNGCPPNYIHSLDASHMMLTSLYCEKNGITFVSVHDSFWTHPSDIEKMGKILREQFINLYSDDLLNSLSNYFLNVYKPYLIENSLNIDKTDLQILNLIKNVPNRGKFDINQVLESKYFFS